jgi:signal transduction histidine kinase
VLRKTGHEINVECQPGLVVDTYPGALAQVLTNLIMNAIVHAFAPGVSGCLTLQIDEQRPGSLRILFSDDGKGIAAENLGKVFDPFFTTARSRGNTGLGLHIVFNLVTSRLQGRIDVDSKLGEGTRFTIVLPTRVVEAVPERMLASA